MEIYVFRILDMLNIMAYDFHGHFEPYIGHIAPLYASHLDTDGQNATLNVVSIFPNFLINIT